MRSLLNEIRDCFSIDEGTSRDAFLEKMLQVREELETNVLLKEELERLQGMLVEAQNREKELLNERAIQSSSSATSNFTRNLLLSKDKELERAREESAELRRVLQEKEAALWSAMREKEKAVREHSELQGILRTQSEEGERHRNAREVADKNSEELKSEALKLARQLEEKEEELQRLRCKDENKVLKAGTEAERMRANYESLLQAVLAVEFAHDEFLESLLRNQSYACELDQALSHLRDQKEIVDSLL